jgi:hypothetical protein
MRIPQEWLAEAKAWAEAQVDVRTPDDRWALMADLMAAERTDEVERCKRSLRLEAIRKLVAPNIPNDRWNKGLDPNTNMVEWIHNERLRDAAYPSNTAEGDVE